MNNYHCRILVAVIATLAVASISSYGQALGGSASPTEEQIRETIRNIRLIMVAVLVYQVDYNEYPTADDVHELIEQLVPVYVQRSKIVPIDAWGNELLVRSSPSSFELVCQGSDGRLDAEFHGGARKNLDDDIVVKDGEFVQCPELYCDSCAAEFCESDVNAGAVNAGAQM